jgi:hypothetical protein
MDPNGKDLKPPNNIQVIFCEIKWQDNIAEQYPFYVVERVIDKGDAEAEAWVRKRYGDAFVRNVLCRTRKISRSSAGRWAKVFNIAEQEVLVLSKAWRDDPNHLWPY